MPQDLKNGFPIPYPEEDRAAVLNDVRELMQSGKSLSKAAQEVAAILGEDGPSPSSMMKWYRDAQHPKASRSTKPVYETRKSVPAKPKPRSFATASLDGTQVQTLMNTITQLRSDLAKSVEETRAPLLQQIAQLNARLSEAARGGTDRELQAEKTITDLRNENDVLKKTLAHYIS